MHLDDLPRDAQPQPRADDFSDGAIRVRIVIAEQPVVELEANADSLVLHDHDHA